MGPPPYFTTTIIIVAVVTAVGIEIMEKTGVEPENLSDTCLGLFACGWPSLAEAAVLGVLGLCVLVVIVWGLKGGFPRR